MQNPRRIALAGVFYVYLVAAAIGFANRFRARRYRLRRNDVTNPRAGRPVF